VIRVARVVKAIAHGLAGHLWSRPWQLGVGAGLAPAPVMVFGCQVGRVLARWLLGIAGSDREGSESTRVSQTFGITLCSDMP
jgi:hypothetical protein